MPLSRNRSRPRIPLFRSFSASAAKDKDKDPDAPRTTPLGSLGFSLPTLSTLANLNLHRRGRSKSNAKRSSLDSRWKSGGAAVQEQEQQQEQQQQQQHVPEAEIEAETETETEAEAEAEVEATKPTSTATTTSTTTKHPHLHLHPPTPIPIPIPNSSLLKPPANPTTADLAAADPAATAPATATAPAPIAPATASLSATVSDTFPPAPIPAAADQATPSPPSAALPTDSATPSTPILQTPTSTPTSSACADSNNSSLHPIIRHSTAPSPKISPQDPTNTIPTTTTTTTTIPSISPPPPPFLVVQRPSTPTVPILAQSDPDSHESLPAMQRKIWVKRPGASPTRVEVAEDDLVDNVRDVILRKYANSLGRSIDAPDIALKILSREPANKNITTERILGPEEPIGKTLDAYYPGGQTIEEALLIDVPSRRTPRASPRAGNHQISYFYPDQYRPDDAAREYFPPMPVHSPHLAHVQHQNTLPHAMSVLTTGQLPPLPSPGSHSARRHGGQRPVYRRQHTSSPTILHTVQPNGQVIGSLSHLSSGGQTDLPQKQNPR
jgi:osomolarity two-component system response regulator SSK1